MMLAALFCGAFICTSANAKVCFVGDDNCAEGTTFEPDKEHKPENLCSDSGYKELAEQCKEDGKVIGAVCPYDARYVICCGKEYAYQSCLYPLEGVPSDGGGFEKCGSLYMCKCPAEYKIDDEYAKNNNCRPGGGYCLLNNGTSDTVSYKTCTCDRSVFTDAGNCLNNQTEDETCKDGDNNVYKKCYCDRSEGKYPYASCEYGHKGSTCIDSNSKREYYHECKTPREKCLEEDYIAENVMQCPQGDRACTSTVSGTPYYCALGEGCPYPTIPQLYRCRFDKGRWCKANGFGQESSTPIIRNSPCTDLETGLEGKSEPCPENTDTPTYYYKCKLTCEQRAQYGATKLGDLAQDMSLANAGIKAYYNVMDAEKHLYVAQGGEVPTANLEHWRQIGSKIDYKSINGIYALCDRNENRYMECCEERGNYSKRPVLQFDGMDINDTNYFLSKDMSDIGVEFYASNRSDGESFGENFVVDNNYTWNNVTLVSNIYPATSAVTDSGDEKYWRIKNKNTVILRGGKTLRLTGLINFDTTTFTNDDPTKKDMFEPSRSALFYTTHFRAEGDSKVRFEDATIAGHGFSWDGDNSTMLFFNTKMESTHWDTLGDIWSYWNVGLKDSEVTVNILRVGGWQGSTYNFPWSYDAPAKNDNSRHARYRCHGVYLYNSDLTIDGYYGYLHHQYSKIYVDWRSSLTSDKPIQLRGSNSDMICVEGGGRLRVGNVNVSSGSTNTMFYGWNKEGTYVGGSTAAFKSTLDQEWYNRFKKCNDKGENCYWPSSPICSYTGWFKDNGDGHDTAYYPNKTGSTLCTACNTCSSHGMGFN